MAFQIYLQVPYFNVILFKYSSAHKESIFEEKKECKEMINNNKAVNKYFLCVYSYSTESIVCFWLGFPHFYFCVYLKFDIRYSGWP